MRNLYMVSIVLELILCGLNIFYAIKNRKNEIQMYVKQIICVGLLCLIQVLQIYVERTLEMASINVVFSIGMLIYWGIDFLFFLFLVFKQQRSKKHWKGYLFDREDIEREVEQ